MKYPIIGLLGISSLLSGGCGQLPDFRSYTETDLKPPALIKLYPDDAYTVTVIFDEKPEDLTGSRIVPTLDPDEPEIEENRVILRCGQPMEPGREYTLTGTVRDARGNTMTFLYPFYGYNGSPPKIIITEITTQGSTTHPDRVELLALSAGDLAGLCFTEGTTDTWKTRLIFPPCAVMEGEFIIIHCKPQGIPEEVDETGPLDASGGLDAHPGARDFWVPGGTGLGGNNGVVALYSFPGGALMDGFLYSNRTSSSDEDYRGFGTLAVMEMADQLYEEGGWQAGGELIAPEDGANPDPTTATRSLCRHPDNRDSDTKEDWHVVPTGAASFGETNSSEVYIP